jgi:Protein of unknown function (DUF2628)
MERIMPAFAVLEPPGYHDTAERADRFIFLHERFSPGAFLLGPLWMIWQRLWLELLVYLAGVAAIGYGLYALGVGWPAVILALSLIQLFLGLEATTLVHGMRVRRGWRDGGVVIADDLDLAERRFFDDRVALRSAVRAAAAPPGFTPPSTPGLLNPGPLAGAPPGPSQPGVVGLFPKPGGGQ